jgi:hypothetical protein
MAIEGVVEEVATNLEEVADATRSINTAAVGYFVGGVALGAALGFFFGYRFNREKIKAEAFSESEAEVEKIRKAYQETRTAVVVVPEKPSVAEVIEERGYSTAEPSRPLRAPVPVNPSPVSAPPVVTYEGGKSKDANWDYAYELEHRNPDEPYVIHQDEFKNSDTNYIQITYTYYAGDDVLVSEDGKPVPHGDLIVGQENLKWGHGADDIDVVFVRNEHLELEIEICRSPKSYEEEVLGLESHEED